MLITIQRLLKIAHNHERFSQAKPQVNFLIQVIYSMGKIDGLMGKGSGILDLVTPVLGQDDGLEKR